MAELHLVLKQGACKLDSEDGSAIFNAVNEHTRLSVEEAMSGLQKQLDASTAEAKALRAHIVSDTLRMRKHGDADLNVKSEEAYLEGLPADRLLKEYERTASSFDAGTQTKNEKPKPVADDDDPKAFFEGE